MTKGAVLFFLLVLVCFVVTPVSGVDVTGPMTISSPGTYQLTTDLTSGDASISITSSDVVLEGNGHSIGGAGSDAGTAGVYVYSAGGLLSNVVVRNLKVSNHQYGIYFVGVQSGKVEGCTVNGNAFGIGCNQDANGNTITGNTITGNTYGLAITSSSTNSISSNTVTGNSATGIYLYSTSGNTITNNNFNNIKNADFKGSVLSNTWNTAITAGSNIIGGQNRGGNFWGSPDGNGFSQKAADANSDGIADQALTLASNNIDQYPLASSTAPTSTTTGTTTPTITATTTISPTITPTVTLTPTATVTGNEIPVTGPMVISSPGVYGLTQDIATSVSGNAAITITSSDVILHGNGHTMSNGVGGDTWGLIVMNDNQTLSNVTVSDLTVTAYKYGVSLYIVQASRITGCHITGNTGVGLGIAASQSNQFVNNYFNNTVNIVNYDPEPKANTWNTVQAAGINIIGGPTLGGNFWGNPDGKGFSDLNSDTNGNGICSAVFTIDSKNEDQFPLTKNVGSGQPTPTPVTTVTTSTTTITPTETVPVPTHTSETTVTTLSTVPTGVPGTTTTTTPTSGPTITTTTTTTPLNSTIVISDLNLVGEWVNITNKGSIPVSLENWKIQDTTKQNLKLHTFTFGIFTLAPGATVTVHTLNGTNSSTDLYWGLNEEVWNNDGDTASLYDSAGNLISTFPPANPSGNVTPTVTPLLPETIVPTITAVPPPPADAIPVTGPVVITKPGYYLLMNDIQHTDEVVCIDIRCSDVTFNGNGHTISGRNVFNTYGVSVYQPSTRLERVVITNLATADWFYGVSFWDTHDGRINTVTATRDQYGIILQSSTGDLIDSNTAQRNTQGGILLLGGSDENMVFKNVADSDTWGFYLSSAKKNTVLSNYATANNQNGIGLYSAGNNTIVNNFLNNTQNVEFQSTTLSNNWSVNLSLGTNIIGGVLFGGNYWAAPTGTGYSETAVDADVNGICDQPYSVGTGNVDQNPLHATSRNPFAAIPVNNSTVITEPGTYVLQNDITGSEVPVCIDIRCSDVIFDGNGHTISGLGTFNTYGVSVYNASKQLERVTVKNLTASRWGYGISYMNTQQGTIDHCTLTDNHYGVVLTTSITTMLRDLTARSNLQGGILFLADSKANTLYNCTAESNQWGVFLSSASDSLLFNNHIINNNMSGMSLIAANGNTIVNNYFSNVNNTDFEDKMGANVWNMSLTPGNNIAGGPLYGGNYWGGPNQTGFSDLTPDDNNDGICDQPYHLTATNVDLYPLRYVSTLGLYYPITSPTVITRPGRYLVMQDFTVSDTQIGIDIRCSDVIVDGMGHTITGAKKFNSNGLSVYNDSNQLSNVTISNLSMGSWFIGANYLNTRNCRTDNVTTVGNDYGVVMTNGERMLLNHTDVSANTYDGLSLSSVVNSQLIDITADSSGYGIWSSGSSGNTYVNCSASNNQQGIQIQNSKSNLFQNTTAESNTVGLSLLDQSSFNQVEAGSFSKNGRGIVINSSGNATVSNVTASNCTAGSGITITDSAGSVLTSNLADHNTNGISLQNANNGVIHANQATNNTNNGILLNSGAGTFISENNATQNGDSGLLLTGSSKNRIGQNTLTGNAVGFRAEGSSDNSLVQNLITTNGYAGVSLAQSSNRNTIFHNTVRENDKGIVVADSEMNVITDNIFSNLVNALLAGNPGMNAWNISEGTGPNIAGGPYQGGNFWTTPGKKGFSDVAVDNDHDGFSDQPLTIGANNVDQLPLLIYAQVQTPVLPTTSFTVDKTSGPAPIQIRFTDTSIGNPSQWLWDFGDGTTSSEQNPAHMYSWAGIFTVKLTTTTAAGSTSMIQRKMITITTDQAMRPVANFIASSTDGTSPMSVQFTDTSVGHPDHWIWTFGDGSTDTMQNPSHTYKIDGTYAVTMQVSNQYGTDTETKDGFITVRQYVRTERNGALVQPVVQP
jgi:parallel beta-helix repeat protein